MPRGPRLDAPGVIHHLTLRGVGGRDLFHDDHDRENFFGRLDDLVPELGFCCLAEALMSNHVHIIIRSGVVRVSTLMARLCTGYALYFARRYDWKGHVFQNRFGSSRIGDDDYLRAAIAYVHRNPVDAGMVTLAQLALYPWTSHSAALGARPPRRFESVRETLAVFGGDPRSLVEAVARARPIPLDLQWRRLPRLTPAPAPSTIQSFEALLSAICETHSVQPSRLLSGERSRPVAAVRRQIAVRAIRELGVTPTQVARRLRISPAAVTQIVARARALDRAS